MCTIEVTTGSEVLYKFLEVYSAIADFCSTYFPVWAVNTEMLGKLMEASGKFVQTLLDLAKEVGEYNQCQRDKMKANVSSVCVCSFLE